MANKNKGSTSKEVPKTQVSPNLPSPPQLSTVRDRAPSLFYEMLGQTHVNGWSRVVATHNGDSTSYIFPLRLGVLQWSRHLFNYWKNKKTIIEKFIILLI